MEVESPASLSVAPAAIPEETENVENNLQNPVEQQPITSPANNIGQMLPPDEIPPNKSNESINNENLVSVNLLHCIKTIFLF